MAVCFESSEESQKPGNHNLNNNVATYALHDAATFHIKNEGRFLLTYQS
jgi:hypothetical protein